MLLNRHKDANYIRLSWAQQLRWNASVAGNSGARQHITHIGVAVKDSELAARVNAAKFGGSQVLPKEKPAEVTLADDMVVLAGHEAEVFCCSWHPHDELLASGSGDSTVRLWNIDSDTSAAQLAKKPPNSKILEYVAPTTVAPIVTNQSTTSDEDHDVIFPCPSWSLAFGFHAWGSMACPGHDTRVVI